MTKTEICNLALSHFGEAPIADITDATEVARRCAAAWPNCLDDALSAFPWNFATKTAKLSALDEDELPPGWDYAYQYPSLCLRVWEVLDSDYPARRPKIDFKIAIPATAAGKGIFCNLEDAYARYTFRQADTSLFTPSFNRALSYVLAGELALSITRDQGLRGQLLQVAQAMMSEAYRRNASESFAAPSDDTDSVDARG